MGGRWGERAKPCWSSFSLAFALLGSPRTRSWARGAATPRRPPGSGARAVPSDVCRCRQCTAAKAVLLSVRQPPDN
eukprot:6174944-Pleurochrysis_carterae.AAC.1